jgi:hypothetical protein
VVRRTVRAHERHVHFVQAADLPRAAKGVHRQLKPIGKEPTRQRAVLGSTIAFSQENVLMHPEGNLPHNISVVSRSLSIIFIGSKPPSDAQLSKVFRVNTKEPKTVLDEFRYNGHMGFQTGTWNMEELELFEADPDSNIQKLTRYDL